MPRFQAKPTFVMPVKTGIQVQLPTFKVRLDSGRRRNDDKSNWSKFRTLGFAPGKLFNQVTTLSSKPKGDE